jgi:hypothetical protein
VHLRLHDEGNIGVDEDNKTLESMLAIHRNLVDLFLTHVVELNFVSDEEPYIVLPSDCSSEVDRHVVVRSRLEYVVISTQDLLDPKIEDHWMAA